jgi:hypothetical protein
MRLGARTLPPLMRGLPGTKLRYNDSTTWGCIQSTSADLVGTDCASEVIRYNERSAPKRCFICCRYGRHCSVILQPTHALPSASESAESCNLQPRTFNCSVLRRGDRAIRLEALSASSFTRLFHPRVSSSFILRNAFAYQGRVLPIIR